MHAHVGIQEEKDAALSRFRSDVPRRRWSLAAGRSQDSDAAGRGSLDGTIIRTVVDNDDFNRRQSQAPNRVQAFVQIVAAVVSGNHNRNLRVQALAPVNLDW
jgi:hypothetical protein